MMIAGGLSGVKHRTVAHTKHRALLTVPTIDGTVG